MILEGNCVDELLKLEKESIDLVVTSPPYDNLRVYTKESDWNFDVFTKVAKALTDVLKPGGVIVWVVSDATVKGSETGTSFRQALYFKDACQLNIHDTMIYQKMAPVPLTHNRYEQQFEYMFVFSKGRPKTFNGIREKCKDAGKRNHTTHRKTGDKVETGTGFGKVVKDTRLKYNVWLLNNCLTPATRFGHPAPFPLELAQGHVLTWSNEGDTVLDPFVGSGTTGVAAVSAGRKFIGIDVSSEYVQIAKQRIGV